MSELLVGVAALITAVGSFIASIISARKAWKAVDELSPNHGGSVKDAVNRTEVNIQTLEKNIQHLDDAVKSVGHQIGEMRRDNAVAREGMQAGLESLDTRVNLLERRRR